eukprot:SAG31_NODE_3837_length_3834_cov_1.902276_2_plen_120_part_00
MEVKDLSGFGGSKVMKISAGAEAVALKVRVEMPGTRGHTDLCDAANEARIADAAALLGGTGLGPVRLAEGESWFIERWGGIPLSAYHRVKENGDVGGALERDAPDQWGEVRVLSFRLFW